MANELTLSGSLSYSKTGYTLSAVGDSITNLLLTVSGGRFITHSQLIGFAAEEALQIGELASLGYGFFKNLDSTNFVELRVATGGAKFCKLKAGEFALFRFGSGATVPYAIADTGNCQLWYMIVEA